LIVGVNLIVDFDLRVRVDLTVHSNLRLEIGVDLIVDFDFNLGLNMNVKLEPGLDA